METEPKPTFAEIVRRWRETRKLSKVEAARALDIPYRTLQDWEYGARTPRGIARRLIIRKLSLALTLAAILWLTLAAASGTPNGNYWRGFTPEGKIFYLGGLYEGIAHTLQNPAFYSWFNLSGDGRNLIQFSDGLDLFYADFRNRKIYIADAVVPVGMAINGAATADINKCIEAMRKAASDRQ